jgi:hypothetical protein
LDAHIHYASALSRQPLGALGLDRTLLREAKRSRAADLKRYAVWPGNFQSGRAHDSS